VPLTASAGMGAGVDDAGIDSIKAERVAKEDGIG